MNMHSTAHQRTPFVAVGMADLTPWFFRAQRVIYKLLCRLQLRVKAVPLVSINILAALPQLMLKPGDIGLPITMHPWPGYPEQVTACPRASEQSPSS